LARLLVRAQTGVDFHNGGLVQQGVARLIRDGDFDLFAHIEGARQTYRARRDAMLDALETRFPPSSGMTWTRPAGGFFLWLELPEGADAATVSRAALQHGVAVFPGPMFFPNGGGKRAMRLSYSNTTPERIAEGIRRLATAIDSGAGRAR
jgi:2-aminoadipate transaminase